MPEVTTLLQGFSASTSEGGLAYCTVTLLRGRVPTLVDVGYQARREQLVDRLAALGLTPEDIGRVILTHAHWDHSFNLSYFPNAEVVLHRDEYDYARQPHKDDWATPAFVADILARAKSVTAVHDGDEIEPGVRILATPGHSPGSLTVLVDGPAGATIGLCGDALPSRAATAVLMPRWVFWDEEAAHRSASRIVETCRDIYPGHDRPFRAQGGSFQYLEPAQLDLVNPPRDPGGEVRSAVRPEETPFATGVLPFARRRP
jgi:glyoxylase-like metal-dependent hydrolase (beta-lactamase superfamily II)